MALDRRCNKSLYDELMAAALACQQNDYEKVVAAIELVNEMFRANELDRLIAERDASEGKS